MSFGLYTPEQEENLFIRREARTWHRSGLLLGTQRSAIDARTDPMVVETNLFFRILFAFFTLNGCSALIGFCFWLMDVRDPGRMWLPLALFATGAYGLADHLVKSHRWYRHGVEEALAAAALTLWCGAGALLLETLGQERWVGLWVALLCAFLAFGLYFRFGYLWAALIGCLALCTLPFAMHLSAALDRRIGLWVILAATLLATIILVKPAAEAFRKKRRDLLRAVLFAGLYAAVNLRLPDLGKSFFSPFPLAPYAGFPPFFYWASYILIFLLPAAGLCYGVRARCRPFIVAGAVTAVTTLSTNKDYLGLRHYAWDPAILGVLLVAGAVFLIRWLSKGKGGARHGITAESLLVPENHGTDAAALGAALTPGFVDSVQPEPQPQSPFEGGQSGGGGAQRPS